MLFRSKSLQHNEKNNEVESELKKRHKVETGHESAVYTLQKISPPVTSGGASESNSFPRKKEDDDCTKSKLISAGDSSKTSTNEDLESDAGLLLGFNKGSPASSVSS